VTLVIGAGPVVAAADDDDGRSTSVRDVLRKETGPLVLPAPVSAEIDRLIGERLGRAAHRAYLEDLAANRFQVVALEPEEYGVAARVDEQYPELQLGLADLAIVVLARRYRTRRILTFDHQCFRTMKPLQGGTFTLLPADTSDQATLPLN
jgi:predicted nucleic acid-binding protein